MCIRDRVSTQSTWGNNIIKKIMEDDWEPDTKIDSILKPTIVTFTDKVIEKLKKEEENKKEVKKEDEKLLHPYFDEKCSEYIDHTFKKTSKDSTILSCPMCFTTLCYDCQPHEEHENQYRAMFVESCKVQSRVVTIRLMKTESQNRQRVQMNSKCFSKCLVQYVGMMWDFLIFTKKYIISLGFFLIHINQVLSLIHISEPTRPLYISYAVFCLKKKKLTLCSYLHQLTSALQT
eukprot:TRINITY_DN22899_c0_g1_i1.p1 TRINITY_DN22899_c0_g1~~TRINITY_DN22899_c0_g1_i1.p1  ORF type:complete len:233 (+),score=34.09 TRINITY_DN22899_c0_g1_i1:174-872(+)